MTEFARMAAIANALAEISRPMTAIANDLAANGRTPEQALAAAIGCADEEARPRGLTAADLLAGWLEAGLLTDDPTTALDAEIERWLNPDGTSGPTGRDLTEEDAYRSIESLAAEGIEAAQIEVAVETAQGVLLDAIAAFLSAVTARHEADGIEWAGARAHAESALADVINNAITG